MKEILFFLCLLSSHLAFAVCTETDGGKISEKKGLTKWVMKNTCSGNEKNCRTIASYEKDYCLNENTLVEFYCEKDLVKQENIPCANGCEKASCK